MSPETEPHVRRAHPGDVADILRSFEAHLPHAFSGTDSGDLARGALASGLVGTAAPFGGWVAVDARGAIVGWSALWQGFSHPAKLNLTAEMSIYVDADHRGHAVGRRLMAETLRAARGGDVHYVFGFVRRENEAALRLCRAGGGTEASLPGSKDTPGKTLFIWGRDDDGR